MKEEMEFLKWRMKIILVVLLRYYQWSSISLNLFESYLDLLSVYKNPNGGLLVAEDILESLKIRGVFEL